MQHFRREIFLVFFMVGGEEGGRDREVFPRKDLVLDVDGIEPNETHETDRIAALYRAEFQRKYRRVMANWQF